MPLTKLPDIFSSLPAPPSRLILSTILGVYDQTLRRSNIRTGSACLLLYNRVLGYFPMYSDCVIQTSRRRQRANYTSFIARLWLQYIFIVIYSLFFFLLKIHNADLEAIVISAIFGYIPLIIPASRKLPDITMSGNDSNFQPDSP